VRVGGNQPLGVLVPGETELNLALMRLIDEQHLRTPYYGARQMARHLPREGYVVGRKRISG
jgi:putative transposase